VENSAVVNVGFILRNGCLKAALQLLYATENKLLELSLGKLKAVVVGKGRELETPRACGNLFRDFCSSPQAPWNRACYEILEKPFFTRIHLAKGCSGTRLARVPAVPEGHFAQGGVRMEDRFVRLGPREEQIAELLLQGCDNTEIAKQLRMARRTVKAHFNRLFLRFGITSGIKRVKLATILYRRQLCSEQHAMETARPASASSVSSNLSHKGSRTGRLRTPLEPQNTSLRIISALSTINSGSGTESSLHSGTKPADLRTRPELLEAWEHRLFDLEEGDPGYDNILIGDHRVIS